MTVLFMIGTFMASSVGVRWGANDQRYLLSSF
jgi:hypothetical protein